MESMDPTKYLKKFLCPPARSLLLKFQPHVKYSSKCMKFHPLLYTLKWYCQQSILPSGPGCTENPDWDLVAVARGTHVAGESHVSSEHVSVSSTRNGCGVAAYVTSGRAVEYIYWFAVFFNSIFLIGHLDVSLAGTIFV